MSVTGRHDGHRAPADHAHRRSRRAARRAPGRTRPRRRGRGDRGGAVRRRRGRQDPAAGRAARARPTGRGVTLRRRALPGLRRGGAAVPAVHRGLRPAGREPAGTGRGGRGGPPGRAAVAARPPPPRHGDRHGWRRRRPGSDDRVDRAALFEAVAASLAQVMAVGEPLLLVVEDAHWADESTRDLLGFLLTRLGSTNTWRWWSSLPQRRPAPPSPAAPGRGRVGAAAAGPPAGPHPARCRRRVRPGAGPAPGPAPGRE